MTVLGAASKVRFAWLDIARGVALLAMASYHLIWDLQSFGFLEPNFASTGLPRLYARAIASSFMFLAGISFVLAQTPVIVWRPYFIRLGKIGLAAGAVTIATYFASPRSFIYFGILHSIAVASILGLIFLRIRPSVTFIIAVGAILAPIFFKTALFDSPWLWWIGLATKIRVSDDFVPLLPWIGPFLLGIALTKAGVERQLLPAYFGDLSKSWWKAALTFLGRHSLVVYLVHQPLLLATVYGVSLVVSPVAQSPAIAFQQSCTASCVVSRSENFCKRFCACTLDRLLEQNLFTMLHSGEVSPKDNSQIQRIAAICTKSAL